MTTPSGEIAQSSVAMTASALLRHAPERIGVILEWIRDWMIEREYDSIEQLKGSVSRGNVPDPAVYERANYYQMLQSWPRH